MTKKKQPPKAVWAIVDDGELDLEFFRTKKEATERIETWEKHGILGPYSVHKYVLEVK
jgi:hypothetical protein